MTAMEKQKSRTGFVDMHVHSHYSMDSSMGIDEICSQAAIQGLRGVCITDHVDHNPVDINCGRYRRDEYFEEIGRARSRYAGALMVLSGIEFSSPHLYPDRFEEYKRYPYDCIMASVHYWIGDMMVEDMVESVPVGECFEAYWDEVEKTVSSCEFDCLGHMDFPKRYYMESVWEESRMRRLFRAMVKKGIVPEINTSSLRCGGAEAMPGKSLLELYAKEGGERIVLGSDAHDIGALGADFEKLEQCFGKLRAGCFVKRRFTVPPAGENIHHEPVNKPNFKIK